MMNKQNTKNNKTFRQKMYVVLAIVILCSSIVSAAVGGVTVWHNKGDTIAEGSVHITENLTVDGTVSGSNLTTGNTYTYNNLTGTLNLPYANVTGTPSGVGAYSFLIGKFSNNSYYAVNGATNQYVVEWTSTNCSYPIEQANLQGGNIHFTSGTYPIAYNLTITRHGTTWSGDGSTSILQLAGNYTSMAIVMADYVTIQNLQFNGNKNSGVCSLQDVGHATGCGVYYKTGVGLKVSKCDFLNFGTGHPVVNFPSFPNSTYGTVTQCYFFNNSWWDIAWAGGDYNTVENCILVNSTGIELGSVAGSTDYCIASNNELIRCGGFYIGGQNNTVFSNIISDPTGSAGGIQAYPMNIVGSYNTIAYNKFYRMTMNWGYMMNCNSGSYNLLSKNTIVSMKGTSAKSIGIVSGSYNVIDGNWVSDGVIGIYIHDAPSTSNRVFNNDITATTPISDAGTTTLAWDNVYNGTFTVGIG